MNGQAGGTPPQDATVSARAELSSIMAHPCWRWADGEAFPQPRKYPLDIGPEVTIFEG